jgi:oxalate decarboxylase
VLIGFNSGVYEEIDLTEWMAGNPTDVLATNFGKPAALFNRFPRRDVFIADRSGREQPLPQQPRRGMGLFGANVSRRLGTL